jgi:hypothetical protein
MANQAIWIGIAVGVFFAGLGVGYAVFQSSPSSVTLSRQQMMSQMMSDPDAMNDWMNNMMSNQEAMQKMHQTMMNDPNHMQQMHQMMMENPDHMQAMMGQMMMDQKTMDQMHQMMMDDPQHMQQMMGMMGQGMGQGMMGSGMGTGMMDPGIMGQGMMMGSMMMGMPITEQSEILKTIDNIEDLLDQVSAKYSEGDSAGALAIATEAYLENYEYIEGAVADKDSDLMNTVELMLRRDLRHAINTDQSADEIDSIIESIKEELGNIRDLF